MKSLPHVLDRLVLRSRRWPPARDVLVLLRLEVQHQVGRLAAVPPVAVEREDCHVDPLLQIVGLRFDLGIRARQAVLPWTKN